MAVPEAREVAQGDLDIDPMAPQPTRIAHERADVVPGGQEEWQERAPDGPARACQEDQRWLLSRQCD